MYLIVPMAYAEANDQPTALEWQYWNGSEWIKWAVRDETQTLTGSGAVRFLPPHDLAPGTFFGRSLYWLRALWTEAWPTVPTLQRILMNTVMATNTETIAGEIVGSSNGTADQIFHMLRAPVLDDPEIEVREPHRPAAGERAAIAREEGADALTPTPGEFGAATTWVRWHEEADFLQSGPFDRHYVLDHIKGELRFGDSRRGFIPPAGSGNVRASSYRIGGGAAGNRRPGEINSLKTTVPYVDRVYNYEPSEGGADAEDLDDLPLRGAAMLRHRDRAVASDDYRDLALLASAEVWRAKCVPARNLAADRDGKIVAPGAVRLVIVPGSTEDKPIPTPVLLDTVKDFLDARRASTAEVYVVAPDYIRVDVRVEVTLESLDSPDVEVAVATELRRYLHPLTGGPEGAGWQFGRRVRASELYKVVEPVPGVAYISRLEITEQEDRPGSLKAGAFLIYSGNHTVRLFPPET
jgi:predicted phage baseplate assembly protein